MWCPNCVLQSLTDSDSPSFVYFLIWLNPSLILIPPPSFTENLFASLFELCSRCRLSWSCLLLIAPKVWNMGAGDYLFSLIPDYTVSLPE